MMTPSFKCPKCSFRFRVEAHFLGRIAKCPQCSQKMKLTAPAAAKPPLQTTDEPAQPSTNPITSHAAGNGDLGTSSLTMTVPPRTETTPTTHDSNPALEPDTNPELRLPAPTEDSSVSRVAARRASRKVVRNKLKNPAPQQPGESDEKKPLNPAWLGFAAAIILGLAGWGAYAMLFPEKTEVEEVSDAADPDSPIVIDGQTVAVSAAATPTSQPTETPEQVAARQEAERQAEEKAARSDSLKKN